MPKISDILNSANPTRIKTFYAFDSTTLDVNVLFRFRIWIRNNFPKYFGSDDADFHQQIIDVNNLKAYRGSILSFTDIAFRDAAKTARTKLFVAFCICNDLDHFRRYIKVLAEDGANSEQIVTDIYNMLVSPNIMELYPEIFQSTGYKREERMTSFTTTTGVKIVAGTVGSSQRGALQDDARPDLIWYEDFENKKTLRSGRMTKAIWENMEEARTGLAKNGACIYTCNYTSEQGNVHKLVIKKGPKHIVEIIPIIDDAGNPTWNKYTKGDIAQMREDDEDFEGERLCKPSASRDIFFDRESLEKMPKRVPVREIAGLKIFYPFDPSHRYGSGHDVAGGVGLDSSTSVFIDFSTIPARVVATFKNNLIKPDTFGDEVSRESDIFGGCIAGIEKNNHGHATIARAKQLEVNQYSTKPKEEKVQEATQSPATAEYGWHTNALTKPKMLFAFAKAIVDGLIECSDPDLIQEAMSYTRNDLMDNEKDPRLTTRHFDLLIAACIAWQMKDYAEVMEVEEEEEFIEEEPLYPEIGI